MWRFDRSSSASLPQAFELWSLMFCLFGLHWVMPHKIIELFESWQGKFKGTSQYRFLENLCHIACCGVFGVKEMLDALRDVNGPC